MNIELGLRFDILNGWVEKMAKGEVKERLIEALGVFKGHGKKENSE